MENLTSFRIRPADLADEDSICAHRRLIFEEEGYHDAAASEAMDQAFRPWLRRHLAAGTYRGWLAESEATGEIAAGVGLWILDWPPHLHAPGTPRARVLNVYTAPEYRRRGLARQLLRAALDWCTTQNISGLMLQTTTVARGVYESLGFRPVNELRLFLPPGD